MSDQPRRVVFLSHATEDKQLAEGLARSLMEAGIQTFYDAWEIRTGDSLRQKVDQGLADCTHFAVLLTPKSVGKPWVNAEIDAGFIQYLQGNCSFLPIRTSEIAISSLPPLLQGLRVLSIDQEDGIKELVSDVYEVSKAPPIGIPPGWAQVSPQPVSGLSSLASKIAWDMATHSEHGLPTDQFDAEELLAYLGCTRDDFLEAVDELNSLGLVELHKALGGRLEGIAWVSPSMLLYVTLDPLARPWNPETDAVRVAVELLNAQTSSMTSAALAQKLGWSPRRLNPALHVLTTQGAVDPGRSLGSAPFLHTRVSKTVRTRRFVRNTPSPLEDG